VARVDTGHVAFFCMLSAVCALTVEGCSEKAGGTRYPNELPETYISSGPSETSPNYYHVEVFWYGTDSDGEIARYEIAVVKNLRRGDPLDLDSLDWHSTRANDSTIVVPADSCCYGDPAGGDTYYAVSYWGILVRAIDNDGGVDATPDGVFFLATNEVPIVWITAPPSSPRPWNLCTVPYFEWAGMDPDGDDTELEYKYLAIPSRMRQSLWEDGLPPYDYEGSGGENQAPEIGTWSRWVPADCTYVADINLSDYRPGQETEDSIGFYVTVRDEAGASLPQELFGAYAENRNVLSFTVAPDVCGPMVRLAGERLNLVEENKCSGVPDQSPVIFSGTGVFIVLSALEVPRLGKMATSYRYFFDSRDDPLSRWNTWTDVDPLRVPGAEPEWEALWPTGGFRFIPPQGQHVLHVELKDRSQDTTCAELHFEVIERPGGQGGNILLVDDNRANWWTESEIPDYESSEFEMWSSILEGYNWQEWDTGSDFSESVPSRLVGDATTVIWSVDLGTVSPGPDLLDLCSRRGNYLHSYVEMGGNLIIIGMAPVYSTAYWFDGIPEPGQWVDFVDIDFSPRIIAGQVSSSHFMWEIMGIKRMRVFSFPSPICVRALEPCDGYEGWGRVAVRGPESVSGWPGYFTGAFLATEFRPGDDVHPFYGTSLLVNPAEPDTAWVEVVNCEKIAGVYVEGGGERGWAAYIGLPAWWFERAEIGSVIRRLLELFGETPEG
jgi:hypothetical protein